MDTSLQRLLQQAVRRALPAASRDGCVVDAGQCAAAREGRGAGCNRVVITVASYTFRILVICELGEDLDAGTLLGWQPDPGAAPDLLALRDAHAEFANMLGGAIKGALLETFPHVGMSTPCVLDAMGGLQLAALTLAAQQVFTARLADGRAFRVVIGLCRDAAEPFEVQVPAEVQDAEGQGELELF